MMDNLELACERASLDLREMETVLGCIRHHLKNGMRPGTPEEILRGAIGHCFGADDCGLCLRVLESLG